MYDKRGLLTRSLDLILFLPSFLIHRVIKCLGTFSFLPFTKVVSLFSVYFAGFERNFGKSPFIFAYFLNAKCFARLKPSV